MRTVKHADEIVLLVKKEIVLQGVVYGSNELER